MFYGLSYVSLLITTFCLLDDSRNFLQNIIEINSIRLNYRVNLIFFFFLVLPISTINDELSSLRKNYLKRHLQQNFFHFLSRFFILLLKYSPRCDKKKENLKKKHYANFVNFINCFHILARI